MNLKESDIARTCSGLLIADGWRMLITDPVSNHALGKGFGEIGMADRLYIRYGLHGPHIPPTTFTHVAEVLWIEWKREVRGKATKPTDHQKAWHMAERAQGATTWIAGEDFPATIEGFSNFYSQCGLRRR